jgi:hypothetical protein
MVRGEGLSGNRVGAAVADDPELERRQRAADLFERLRRDRDLEVLVLARLVAAEEVERPARDDVPARVDAGEPSGGLGRMPGVPEREVRLERVGRAQIQRRQR